MQRLAWRKSVRCKRCESRTRLNHVQKKKLIEVGIDAVSSGTSNLVHDLMNALSLAAACEGYKTCSTDLAQYCRDFVHA